jgi:phosphoadenosine phosphosulfate reductase
MSQTVLEPSYGDSVTAKHQVTLDLLYRSYSAFGEDLALACSFGAEDVVLVDMVVKIQPKAKIFVLDTGRLHEET